MKLRQIADTGVRVSPLGLGTVKLGRDQAVKYPQRFTIPDDKQAMALLQRARQLGINLLDTAPAYGNSEQRLGGLLQGQRQDWVLCTKVGEEFEQGRSHYDFSPRHIASSVERSLKRLQTDYLDLVLVHSNGDDVEIIERYGALDQLATLKQAGKIRAFGMSTKTIAGGLLAASVSDCVMVTYNLDYRDELAVLDYCAANGKGVLIKKALGSGHLNPALADPVLANMRFIFRHPAVTAIVLGTINPQHLAANVASCKRALSLH
jgi:aryl-alcohol dehydrogenase-like predicted oxidoreductase